MNDRFMNTYARTGLVLDHGVGARLFTTDGTEYIDFTAGYRGQFAWPRPSEACRCHRRAGCKAYPCVELLYDRTSKAARI